MGPLERTIMNLEFGSGSRPAAGWEGCDIRPSEGVKYVCNCWDIHNHVPEGSVEGIYSRHMFEHLTFKQGEMTLSSWYKILKPGGVVDMNLPDLKYHVDEYLRFYNNRDTPNKPNFNHAIGSLFGQQRQDHLGSECFTAHDNLWDVHKSGYDEVSLKILIEKYGYINFVRKPLGFIPTHGGGSHHNSPWHLDVTFYK